MNFRKSDPISPESHTNPRYLTVHLPLTLSEAIGNCRARGRGPSDPKIPKISRRHIVPGWCGPPCPRPRSLLVPAFRSPQFLHVFSFLSSLVFPSSSQLASNLFSPAVPPSRRLGVLTLGDFTVAGEDVAGPLPRPMSCCPVSYPLLSAPNPII